MPTPYPITVEVSPGELIDRITIMEIKTERIDDPGKLHAVEGELAALQAVRNRAIPPSPGLDQTMTQLKAVNETLWDIENQIRACERDQDFGDRFVGLARSVYHNNDRRSALKTAIDEMMGSARGEVKSYVM